ncbi:MAG: hypothetical protein JO218_10360, partial [Burkholderiales bacterium]|nr:hypothetical protein [Burkholderiales bacterium]
MKPEKQIVSLPTEVVVATCRKGLDELARDVLVACTHPDDPYWDFLPEAELIERRRKWRADHAGTRLDNWLVPMQDRIEEDIEKLDRLLILAETNDRYGDKAVQLDLDENAAFIKAANELAPEEIGSATLTMTPARLKEAAEAVLAQIGKWQSLRREALLVTASRQGISRFFARQTVEQRADELFARAPQPWEELTNQFRRLSKTAIHEGILPEGGHIATRLYLT